jgi:hypothetical protein
MHAQLANEARRPTWCGHHKDFATTPGAKPEHAPKGYENAARMLCSVARMGSHPILRNASRIHRRIFVTQLAKIVLTRPRAAMADCASVKHRRFNAEHFVQLG